MTCLKPLETRHLNSAAVLPCRREDVRVYRFGGGVMDEAGDFVEGTGLHEPPCVVGGAYSAEYDHSELTVIYLGYFLPEWGNTITDGLKKVWFLDTDEGKELLRQGARPVFVTLDNQPLKEYQKEIFRLAGLDTEQWIHVTQPTSFRKVIIPGNSMVTTAEDIRLGHPEFTKTLEQIRKQAWKELESRAGELAFDRIYLTRTRWALSKDSREKEVEEVFRQLGYHILAPEQWTVAEQVVMMMQAHTVAATEGSVAHNAIFMSPYSELIILQKADYVNHYQQFINEMLKLKVTRLPIHHSTRTNPEMPWAGPFYLLLTPELKAWSGLPISIRPAWMYPSYWIYWLKNTPWIRRLKMNLYLLLKERGR